tara:strand:- start:16952 stop:17320 length:369 start_codon:yes stop_codon:yes gene_type:complete
MGLYGKSRRSVLSTVALMLLAGLAATRAGADKTEPVEAGYPCVTVEVNGHRALPLDCLQQRMTPSDGARRGAPASFGSEDIVRQTPNRIGQFSRSALRNRMGNTLGHGVRPQRPERPPPGRY